MKIITIVFLFLSIAGFVYTQNNNLQLPVSINTDGAAPDGSAILDIQASDKGILIPRVSSPAAISSPVEGLMIYQTDSPKGFYFYNGSSWEKVGTASPFRLENMTTGERDLLSPLPGMLIYNTDVGRPQFYRIGAPGFFGDVTNNGNTEINCNSIAQSFKISTSTIIQNIEAKIDFGANMNDVKLKIYEGEYPAQS